MRLWVGTDGEGLNLLDRRNNTFARFIVKDNIPNGKPAKSILSLCKDRDNTILWIGTYGQGVYQFNTKTHKSKNIVLDHGEYRDRSNSVYTIIQDRNSRIWMGTNGGGVFCLEKKSGRVTNYNTNTTDPRYK